MTAKSKALRRIAPALLAAIFFASVAALEASAQKIGTLRTPDSPLSLRARGSFFVGGRTVEQNFVELGSMRAADRITVDQMYVEYMRPRGREKLPVIMVHGASLSGKTYDTTPDGRMGWFEYFVRRGHPAYVVDQVGRGRSGFNQSAFNNAGAGAAAPATQPRITRIGDNIGGWVNFRFGPTPGVPYPDAKFPVEAAAELSRTAIPDLSAAVPQPNPTYAALSTLAGDLNGAAIISHSQSGAFPLEAALLNPDRVKAAVLLEPGSCRSNAWSEEQIAKLAKTPTLVIYGDNLHAETGVSGPNWQQRYDDCRNFIARLTAAGGKARSVFMPDLGVRGNSHMLMQDSNSIDIADLVLKWLDEVT